ncbi:MAG: alpha/beta hydrolase [Planctomycetota bacterium]|jgi:fermentation-respiration switch protein FrsA (DUF1100 family)
MSRRNQHDDGNQRTKSPWPKRLRRVLIIAMLTYAGVCGLVYIFQARLLYHPSRDCHATPADLGLEFEDLTLTTADGLKIAAWYIPSPAPAGTILFCHGNAGNNSDRLVTIRILRSLGYDVLIFDYRGYGRSEGRPDEQGTYRDAQAAWNYLVETRGVPPKRVILLGRSLGGAVAVELAKRQEPAALVVEASFTSLADVARMHYPVLPVRLLCRFSYDSVEKVPSIACPKLFLHATEDELVPLQIGRRLYAAAADPKRFIETPSGHNTGGFTYSPRYTAELGAFLAGLNKDTTVGELPPDD